MHREALGIPGASPVGNRSLVAPFMIVCDLRARVFGSISGRSNALVALIHGRDKKTVMNFLLFVLEIILVVVGIALVPARSGLRIEISDQRDDMDL
jgi:hypothetical protein